MTIDAEAPDADVMSPFSGGDEFDASEAFFEHLEKPRKDPAEAPAAAAEDTTTEETSEAPEVPSKAPSDDDDEVELPFGGETKTFKLSEVRAALEAREKVPAAAPEVLAQVQQQTERAQTALNRLMERAQARYAPYDSVDWISLSRDPDISREAFDAMREEAREALGEMEFYRTELDAVTAAGKDQQIAAAKAATQTMLRELSDPTSGIKGFGPAMIDEMVAFAKANGVPELVNTTSAPMVRLIHQAMLFSKGQAKADAQVQKVVNQPKRVIKPTGTKQSGSGVDRTTAVKALRTSGSQDDVTAAFLADLNK